MYLEFFDELDKQLLCHPSIFFLSEMIFGADLVGIELRFIRGLLTNGYSFANKPRFIPEQISNKDQTVMLYA